MKHWALIGLLLIPVAILPYAAHQLIASEVSRGKTIGQAYLQAQAEVIAAQIKARQFEFTKPELPVLCSIKKAEGEVIGDVLPDDGRCVGVASLEPEFKGGWVKVMWPGEKNPGRARTYRLHCVELSIFLGAAILFILIVTLLVRYHLRVSRELETQRQLVADFSHRLKTPITSIRLCAELAREGRIAARHQECAETIVAEATKLDAIVEEVLSHIEGGTHG